jgi:hypothetical protein
VSSSIPHFPLDSPRLQHLRTTLTPLLVQEYLEKLRTATLPLIAVLDASPLRSTSGLVFDFPSTNVPWGTSSASSYSPTSTTLTPHRSSSSHRVHRRREPTPVSFPPWKGPNWVPPPLELVPRRSILRPRPSVGRISPASHRHGGGIPSPVFPGWAKTAKKAGPCRAGLCFRVGQLGRPPQGRSSGAVRPWAASGPRGRIYLNFSF